MNERWIADDDLGSFADFAADGFDWGMESMPCENRDDRFGVTSIHRAGGEQCGFGMPAALMWLEPVRFHDGADKAADVLLDGIWADPVAELAQEIRVDRLDRWPARLGRSNHHVYGRLVGEELRKRLFELEVCWHGACAGCLVYFRRSCRKRRLAATTDPVLLWTEATHRRFGDSTPRVKLTFMGVRGLLRLGRCLDRLPSSGFRPRPRRARSSTGRRGLVTLPLKLSPLLASTLGRSCRSNLIAHGSSVDVGQLTW